MSDTTVEEIHGLGDFAMRANATARGFKDYAVKEIDPHFDIPPMVMGFRGPANLEVVGEIRADLAVEAIADQLDRDKGLMIVAVMGAIGCDGVAVTFDAHVSSSEINPRTGERWKHGEMQGLCDGEGACDTGLLTDCLMTTVADTSGKLAFYQAMYHWHEAQREVAWIDVPETVEMDETRTDAKMVVQGVVPETVRAAMGEGRQIGAMLGNPLFAGKLLAKVEGTTDTSPIPQARAHRDAGLLRRMAEFSAIVRISRTAFVTNEAEEEIFERLVRDTEPIDWMN